MVVYGGYSSDGSFEPIAEVFDLATGQLMHIVEITGLRSPEDMMVVETEVCFSYSSTSKLLISQTVSSHNLDISKNCWD